MIAVVKQTPEPGIGVEDRPEPRELLEHEVLIAVRACGVCGTDLHIYAGRAGYLGMTLPRILGHEIAGTVVSTGEAVTGFAVGGHVVTETSGHCGHCHFCRRGLINHCENQPRLGQQIDGGMAPFVVAPASSLYPIPASLPFDEAAIIEPAGVAMHALERLDLLPGDSVAIIGPGPIGLLAAMLARVGGAEPVFVIGLEVDHERLALAESLGFEAHTVDGAADATGPILASTFGYGVDAVIDTSGGRGSLDLAVGLVRRVGSIAMVGLGPATEFDYAAAVMKEVTIRTVFRRQPVTWQRAITLVATRRLDVRPIITQRGLITDAPELFELLSQRRGVKAIITPEELS